MEMILKKNTIARDLNSDLNGVTSPEKAAVSAPVMKKAEVSNQTSQFNSAYFKKTSMNDENIPPSNFNELPFKQDSKPHPYVTNNTPIEPLSYQSS
jgi:hypothetical protein